MKNIRLFTMIWIIFLSCTTVLASNTGLRVTDLRCNNITDPDGVHAPRLSWKLTGPGEGVIQTAWEIEIASAMEKLVTGKADVWKSGKQVSAEQFNIKPNVSVWKDGKEYYWRVRISDQTGKVSRWSNPAVFSIGLLNPASWNAKWITYPDVQKNPLPYFRKILNLNKKNTRIRRAMIYLCGLGASELYINGKRVDSTRFLDPAQTNYNDYALYTSFNVTSYLQPVNNCFGVMLGNGWYSQTGAWLKAAFRYGDPMFRLQLIVDYADGTQRVEGSNETWTWKYGPISTSNLYLGEEYDARREVEEWCNPGLKFADWKTAIVASQGIPPRLLPQLMPPIRTHKLIQAVKYWRTANNKWIFDFGINTAGIPMLELKQPSGTKIEIRISEEKKADGELDFNSLGWIHHGAVFTDSYICKGGDKTETWKPKFTYHGFRFAELSGFVGTPDLSALKLVTVYTDLERTGTFSCSDPQINRLHELAVNSVLSNMHGIPTDCPNREKCGWLGDVHAYTKMANMNFRMDNFWAKYMDDIRSGARLEEKNTLFHERFNNTFYFTDKAAGIPYMIAPGKRLCGVASPDWGTTVVQLPWWQYVYSGDLSLLSDHYGEMKQWTDYVSTLATDTSRTNKYGKNTHYIIYQGLGDWCPPKYENVNSTPVEFTSTAFHFLDVSIMEQAAILLGRSNDAERYRALKQAIANEIISVFCDPKIRSFGSQTADVMALDFEIVPRRDRKAVANAVVNNMKTKSHGFLNTGIFGIGCIGSMLARYGNSDAAWELFTKKGEHSFEYMWKYADATSLWETLPVNRTSKEIAAHGSLNHAMQAGYDICFYEDIAGIRPDSQGYGFKVIRFEPQFADYLSRCSASVESNYGTISSSWHRTSKGLSWKIKIPHNTRGLVVLPIHKKIYINNRLLNTQVYKIVGSSDKGFVHSFPSGSFDISIR